MITMKNLKKWQGILREKYSEYEYMKLQEIIKGAGYGYLHSYPSEQKVV